MPEEIFTDNGKVFTNRFGLTPSEVLFDKICRENGIVHRLTAPASPTTTGKIERFHRTLRTEFLGGQMFSSQHVAQKELDAWVTDYNTKRPHQSLGMATPAQRFDARDRRGEPEVALDLRVVSEDRSGEGWVSRTVSVNGTISVSNQVFSVGKQRGRAPRRRPGPRGTPRGLGRPRLAQERPTNDPRGGEKEAGRTPSGSLANQSKVSGITRTRFVGPQPDLHRPTKPTKPTGPPSPPGSGPP